MEKHKKVVIPGIIGTIMQEVRNEKIVPNDTERLEYNPIQDAISRLYGALEEAVLEVMLRGTKTIDNAVMKIEEMWKGILEELEDDAHEILEAFQEQVRELFSKAIARLIYLYPKKIKGDCPAILRSYNVQMSLAFSPSVKVAATEWLQFASTGTVQVGLMYECSDSGK